MAPRQACWRERWIIALWRSTNPKSPFGSNSVLSMKLDFTPPIATFYMVLPPTSAMYRAFPARMANRFSDIVEEARLTGRALMDYGDHFFHPTVRLGVTGLSRAGKTVFITALIHGLTRGGRFPVFEPLASGRIARARLEPQLADIDRRVRPAPLLDQGLQMALIGEPRHRVVGLRLV